MRYLLLLLLPLFFCCKKDHCGSCTCVNYSDTFCIQYPDTVFASAAILGKWYLREVISPEFHMSGGESYFCSEVEYINYLPD